jgi:hypothetical protein
VTALYVMPDYAAMIYGAEALIAYSAEFDKSAQKEADQVLQAALDIAERRGLPDGAGNEYLHQSGHHQAGAGG